jgi:hypothetical protein
MIIYCFDDNKLGNDCFDDNTHDNIVLMITIMTNKHAICVLMIINMIMDDLMISDKIMFK